MAAEAGVPVWFEPVSVPKSVRCAVRGTAAWVLLVGEHGPCSHMSRHVAL